MSLKNRLVEMSGKLENQLPVIRVQQERKSHREWLVNAVQRGKSYVSDGKYIPEGDSLSNQYLINRGADYSPKSGAITNATHISGGISGDSINSPFEIRYGISNQPLVPNIGFHETKKALSLLVTSDEYRIQGRL